MCRGLCGVWMWRREKLTQVSMIYKLLLATLIRRAFAPVKANHPRVAKNNGRLAALVRFAMDSHKPLTHHHAHAPVYRAAFQAKENAQGRTAPVGTVGAAVDTLAVAGQLLQRRKIFRFHFQGLVRGQTVLERIVAFFAWHGSIRSE